MVIAQQSRSGSCVLTCVPSSCEVVSTGEIGTQPLYLAASVTGCTYVSTSSQLAWCRTVSLGTYWYCCGGVLVYTYSSTACTVNSLRSNNFHQFIFSLLQVIRDIRMYIPRLVAYRFLGYVLVLLRRCTRIYVQQYCLYC